MRGVEEGAMTSSRRPSWISSSAWCAHCSQARSQSDTARSQSDTTWMTEALGFAVILAIVLWSVAALHVLVGR